jgi:hypothetical protein
MVDTSETASYESDSMSARSVKTDINDNFHTVHQNESKRSKFVATCYW